jgi:hypothetical protein
MELGIYPEIWDRDPDDDDTFGYCAEYFENLKEFLGRAVAIESGMIVFVS